MKNKSLGITLAALVVASALPAHANDAAASGFYIGVNGGVVGASATVTPNTGANSESYSVGMSGATGGAMIGYLNRAGRLSFGVEAELASMDVNGDDTTVVGGSRTKTELQLDRGARIRLRLGGGLGQRWFVYGAAGLSQANSKMTLTSLSTPGQTASASERLTGANFGIGGEYAIARHLIARVEWVYDFYGSTTYSMNRSNPFFADREADFAVFTLRAALSLKF
jgi:outer membrane immunogenic protein